MNTKNLSIFAFTVFFTGNFLIAEEIVAKDQQAPQPSPVSATQATTQIVHFEPTKSLDKPVAGHCFTSSIALERSDAWRCEVNNSIYDPCFTSSTKNTLICDANPSHGKNGFPLKLTKKLPNSNSTHSSTAQTSKPWILALEDGSICTSYTGSMPLIPDASNMIALQYGCASSDNTKILSSGIVEGSLNMSHKTWTAKKMSYSLDSKNNAHKIKIISVSIKTAWQ